MEAALSTRHAATDLPPETLAYFGGDDLRARVFHDKYALRDPEGRVLEKTPPEMWRRIARELASVEAPEKRAEWEEKFYWLLEDFRFIPGGRIMHAAGNPKRVTALNCYVIPIEDDSIEAIFDWMKRAARTYSMGGGVGCIREGAQVVTRRGVKRIEEVREGEEVASFDPSRARFEWQPVQKCHLFEVANRDAVRITFGDGSYIITSYWHPTLVYEEGKFVYKEAESVEAGDLALAYTLHPGMTPNARTPDEAWLTGAYLGEGCAYREQRGRRHLYQRDYKGLGLDRQRYRLKFAGESREVVEVFAGGINAVCGTAVSAHVVNRPDYRRPVFEATTNSYGLVRLLQDVDWQVGRKARTLRIPSWVWSASQDTILGFLAGLVDTDGSVCASRGRLTLSTASEQLAWEVKALLALLGVESTVRFRPRTGSAFAIGGRRPLWSVVVYDDGFLSQLAPFMRHPEKRRRLREAIRFADKKRSFPLPDDFVRFLLGLKENYGVVPPTIRFGLRHGKRKLRRDVFWRMVNALLNRVSDPRDVAALRYYADLIPRLRRVEHVERGVEGSTRFYDLTVGGNNNYVAGFGGFYVVHNTDISILRPRGSPVNNAARSSTGSVSFMELMSLTTGTIGQSGRRGALMITIADNHPDVLDFVKIKRNLDRVRYANISVRISDAFMQAVERDEPWELVFENAHVTIRRSIRARELWQELIKGARDYAEPGVIFWDTAKRLSTSEYNGMHILTTNPCSEITLEPYGCCCLGNLCLARFVVDPFTPEARVDWSQLERALRYATRFLDNVLDYNADRHPLPQQREASLKSRRIGVGFTGLGDMLIKLGLKYDTEEAIAFVDGLFDRIKNIVYDESVNLAVEKGPFPAYDPLQHFRSPFLRTLAPEVVERIQAHGLRNVALLTVPPVGSGAALAGVTSGIEPIFDLSYIRRSESLSQEVFRVYHPLVREYMTRFGIQREEDLPPVFVTAHQIAPDMRVKMQATIQKHIDHSISSTVNLPHDVPVEEVERIYFLAWKLGAKGITVYRESSREGILITEAQARASGMAAASAAPQPPTPQPSAPVRPSPRPRPKVTSGRTERIETPRGRIYVVVNEDDLGVCEVFVHSFDVEAEAIGRLTSLALRAGVDPREVIEQLWRVQSKEVALDRSSDGTVVRVTTIAQAVALGLGRALYGEGFRPDKEFPRADALPDPLTRARQERLPFDRGTRLPAGEPGGSASERNGEEPIPIAGAAFPQEFVGICPDCGATLIHENGCATCRSCGYSRC